MHPREILDRFDLHPKKSLGQNFLFDEQLLKKIVRSADVESHDHVLEIGPGLGALTRELAISAEKVVAVELDQRLLPVLEYELAHFPNITTIHGDILDQKPADLFDRPYKVIANVPYYITGAILRHLLQSEHKPTTMVMTVQKEVAERLTPKPGKLSLLTVSVQFYGTATHMGNIAAGAFWPRPGVASAIVRVDISAEPRPVTEKAFFRVVRTGFSQKRKQLKNNLAALGMGKEKTLEALISAEIDPTRRPQTLSVEEWVTLTQKIAQIEA